MRFLLGVALLVVSMSALAAQTEGTISMRQAEDKKVQRINFEYSETKLLKSGELRAAMRTQAGKIFKRRFFSSDLVALVNIYRGRGYRDAYIKSKKLVVDRKDQLQIYITLDSGPLWTVEQVQIEGGDPFAAALLRDKTRLQVGDALNYAEVIAGESAIQAFLNSEGFAHAQVRNEIIDREGSHSTAVIYYVDPGRRMYFGAVRITDDEELLTRTSLVQRYLTFRPGDLYDPEEMAQSRSALARTGLFRAVTLAAPDTSLYDSLQTVYIHLQERKYISVGGNALFENTIDPRVNGTIQHHNWLGRGARIGLNASWGKPIQGARVFITERNVLRSDADLTLSAGLTDEWSPTLRFANPDDPRQFDLLTENDLVLSGLLLFGGEAVARSYINTASYDYTSIDRLWDVEASLARSWRDFYFSTFSVTATWARTFPDATKNIRYAPSPFDDEAEVVEDEDPFGDDDDFFDDSGDDFFDDGDDFFEDGEDGFFDEGGEDATQFIDYSEGAIPVDDVWEEVLTERSRSVDWELEVLRDSRDNRIAPTRGTLLRFTGLYAVKLGSRSTFVLDGDIEARRYQPLGWIADDLVLAVAVRGTQTASLRQGRALPVIYWKQFGGEGSLRGVRRNLVTAAGGGRNGLNFRTELRYQMDVLGLVGFWDRAQVWRQRRDIDLGAMVDGYGVGVRYTLGIPFRFDFAFNDGFDRSRRMWFYFSIGQAF
jgi:outer membrane protein assembly factor BamA